MDNEDEINPNPCTRSSSSSCMLLEKKSTNNYTRPPKGDQLMNCPRCKSNNTKFCYYNNYSLTQPRYFCKSCRRYWTEGGSLRNVPVGGGSRKNRTSSKSSSTTPTTMSSSSSSSSSDHHFNNPKLPNYPPSQFSTQTLAAAAAAAAAAGTDLNLAFPSAMSHYAELPKVVENNFNNNNNDDNNNSNNCGFGFRGLSSFIPNLMPNSNNNNNNKGSLGINISSSQYPSGFSLPLDEFKPNLDINSLDHHHHHHHHGFGDDGRNLLAFQELNQHSVADPNESHQQGNNNISTGYWSGMLGGGSL